MESFQKEDVVNKLCDFFVLATQTVLYARRVYPRETFEVREKYGVPVYVSRSPLLLNYVHDVVASFKDWLLQGVLNSVVIAIRSVKQEVVLARYVFDVAVVFEDPITIASLGAMEAQFRAHLLCLCSAGVTDRGSGGPEAENEDLAFDLVLYTKGVHPGLDWIPASDREARVIENAASTPLKDADANTNTVLIASRVESSCAT